MQATQRFRIAHKRFVLVNDVATAREILIRRASLFPHNRFVYDRLKPITGENGLVQLHGEASKQARSKTRSLLSQSNLMLVDKIVRNRFEMFHEAGAFSKPDENHAMIADIVIATALELFLGVQDESVIRKLTNKFLILNTLCGQRMRKLLTLPKFFPNQSLRIIQKTSVEIRSLLNELRAHHISKTTPNQPITLFDIFAEDQNVLDHCMTFIFAGHETTSSSISFTLLLLANHPKYIDKIAAGEEGIAMACYKESLRLFPPAYMLVRDCIEKIEINGNEFLPGDNIIIPLKQIQRMEQNFKAPSSFIPERFLANSTYRDNLQAFFPFGLGRKSCIGEAIAYVEAKAILEEFCRNYTIHTNPKEIDVIPLVTLHPDPANQIEFTARKSEALRGASA